MLFLRDKRLKYDVKDLDFLNRRRCVARMTTGIFILSQILDLVHRKILSRLSARFNAEGRVRHLGVCQQLICLAFSQVYRREGLRYIEACLNSNPDAL
jgi:hypothetical protein